MGASGRCNISQRGTVSNATKLSMIVIPVWDFFENFSVLRQQRIVLGTPFSRAALLDWGGRAGSVQQGTSIEAAELSGSVGKRDPELPSRAPTDG